MINLIRSGSYRLLETKADTKILYLDKDEFAWINAKGIGEILVVSHKEHVTDTTLSVGEYRIFDVKEEPNVTDLLHLELEAGPDTWQSYLLPTGLPNDDKKRSRIIPTKQPVSQNNKRSRGVQ
jgi:hypothetical protein